MLKSLLRFNYSTGPSNPSQAHQMPIDYLAEFPIPGAQVPNRLRALLEPIGNSPKQVVEVTSRYDFDVHGPRREYVHTIMAVVPDNTPEVTPLLEESRDGVVSFSVPVADERGEIRDFAPSISDYDYIVASWGTGSFYAFSLAEKVWMALGLTPRCVGNDDQRIIYDDLSLPEFGIAEGEVSTEFYWSPKRDVSWKMSNEYLRKYLWMRGAYGVRVFFYEALVPDTAELRGLMNGEDFAHIEPQGGWFELILREHNDAILMQVWASVKAVSPELCPDQSADGLIWPDVAGPMTDARANALVEQMPVYLNDKFLQRYEQNSFYGATPVNVHGNWRCSPSYGGQWSFTECTRVGRNLIRVPMRELYKPKPDREIRHAHAFAMSPTEVAHFDLEQEHIVSKTQRLLDQLLDLGDNLSGLAGIAGAPRPAVRHSSLFSSGAWRQWLVCLSPTLAVGSGCAVGFEPASVPISLQEFARTLASCAGWVA
jgi:hypothetical protein